MMSSSRVSDAANVLPPLRSATGQLPLWCLSRAAAMKEKLLLASTATSTNSALMMWLGAIVIRVLTGLSRDRRNLAGF